MVIKGFIILSMVYALTSADTRLNETCHCQELKKSFEWNCGKYYECAVSQLFIRDCPTGLHFNEALQQCVYPSQSTCDEDSICKPSSTTATPTTSTTTTPGPQKCDATHGCFRKACKPFEDVMSVDECRSVYFPF